MYDYLIDEWKKQDIESFDYLFMELSKIEQEHFLSWLFRNKDHLMCCDVEHMFNHCLQWYGESFLVAN